MVYILFLAFALRPICFVGNVLYYQLNIDYIIETYCVNVDKPKLQCNGKCHLAKSVDVSASDTEVPEKQMALIHESFYPLYFQDCEKQKFRNSTSIPKKENWRHLNVIQFQLIYNSFHPPETLI
ncbi:hypothetical protein GCM10011444_15050 [Winogradskyella haliclonae]|uniref:Uncharacterized protein n=2 Tax=Winogradskyella haliclonae TaxID=2048558 RepID=A0ABQ2BZ45_9FLAO|nr:hypothetical protein GCM10011444_15050 [Winogradskyella haliclonae]